MEKESFTKGKRRRSLKRFRAIILYRAYAKFVAEKENSYMGFFWFLLDPMLSSMAYLVIGQLLKHREADFTMFIVTGSIAWQFFSASVNTMADSILRAKVVIRHVYIPKLVFPLADLVNTTIDFLCALVVLFVMLMAFGIFPGVSVIALPLVVMLQMLLCAGVGLILAAVTPFVSDVKETVRGSMRLLGFVSGIFFQGSSLPKDMQFWFYLNPMAHVLEMYRSVLIKHEWPSGGSIFFVVAAGAVLLVVGAFAVNHYDRQYPKALAK